MIAYKPLTMLIQNRYKPFGYFRILKEFLFFIVYFSTFALSLWTSTQKYLGSDICEINGIVGLYIRCMPYELRMKLFAKTDN